MDGEAEGAGLGHLAVAAEGGVLADSLHRQIVGGQLLEQEVVHGLGTAEEEGYVPDVHILLHQLGGHKAVLIAGLLLVAEDVHHPQALGGQSVQFLLVGDALLVPGAVEQGHLIVLIPLGHALGHGEEGGDTGAAGNADDALFVPQGLIVELAGGLGHGEPVAHRHLLVQVAGEEAHVLHAQHQLVFQGLSGAGGDGVGAADQAAAHLAPKGHILSGPEEGEGGGVHPLEGQLGHTGGEGADGGHLHLHLAGVEGLGQHIGAVGGGQGGVGAGSQGRPAVGHQLLEPEHVHKTKNLSLEVHLTSPPA